MKHVDGYGSNKSYETEHISQSYEALVNCSSYFSLPLRIISCCPNLCSLDTKNPESYEVKKLFTNPWVCCIRKEGQNYSKGLAGPWRSCLAQLTQCRTGFNYAITDSCISLIFNLPLVTESLGLPRQPLLYFSFLTIRKDFF